MFTQQIPTLALAAVLALAAPAAAAMDHGSTEHGAHGSTTFAQAGAAPGEAAAQDAHQGLEIRKVTVAGHTLRYDLIDMLTLMQAVKTPMAHGAGKMKSHHLMVYAVGANGKPAVGGKAGFLVIQPDKSEVKTMVMGMEEGYGADVDLVAKGDYKITTKIVLGDTTLVDEFVYTVK